MREKEGEGRSEKRGKEGRGGERGGEESRKELQKTRKCNSGNKKYTYIVHTHEM